MFCPHAECNYTVDQPADEEGAMGSADISTNIHNTHQTMYTMRRVRLTLSSTATNGIMPLSVLEFSDLHKDMYGENSEHGMGATENTSEALGHFFTFVIILRFMLD